MKKVKRMLSLFLVLALLLGTLPLYALANEPDAVVHTEIGEETISSYLGKNLSILLLLYVKHGHQLFEGVLSIQTGICQVAFFVFPL